MTDTEYIEKSSWYTGVANAIRSKKGTSEPINRDDFEREIRGIEAGITPSGSVEIIENGTHNVTNYESAKVNVPIPKGYVIPEGEVTIIKNGEYNVSGKATAIVDVEGEEWDESYTITGEPTGDNTCGATVEGTAIPQGTAPTYVYFNLNNTIEQTNAYLSQLTYVQTDLFEYPVYGICGYLLNDIPILMFAIALKEEGSELHKICVARGNIINDIYSAGKILDTTVMSEYYENNGFKIFDADPYSFLSRAMGFCTTATETTPLTDFMGLPLGLENEKIKNVLSTTPFTSGTSSSGATAYTVSSVDELPSNAVDGSMAIVESDSIVGEWEFYNSLSAPAWLDGYTQVEISYMVFLSFDGGKTLQLKHLDSIGFSGDANTLEELLFQTKDFFTQEIFDEWGVYGESDGWIYPSAWNVKFLEDNEEIKDWLSNNARRISGAPYSLYTRENGSWAYKCEVA